MKIIIHSLDELLELTALLRPHAPEVILRHEPIKVAQDTARLQESLRKEQGKTLASLVDDGEPNGLPADIAPPCTVGYSVSDRTFDEVQKDAEGAHAALVDPERDADGAQYDTRWHSEPKKLTDKGVFRARRGRDNDAYKAWLLEQAVEVAEAAIASDEAEPVATETHALPQDKCWDEGCVHNEVSHQCVVPQEPGSDPSAAPATPARTVDLEALIARSRDVLARHDGAHVTLLNDCKAFVDKHGHSNFTALKDAAVGGRSIPQLTEIDERRLMQACIANYPTA